MNRLTKAKYIEFQASLFGACAISLGLGALLFSYIKDYAIVLIVVGVIIHGWGMYKIHKRNR